MTRFNGWKNYETWAVALWLGNDESTYRYWKEQAAERVLGARNSKEVLAGRCTPNEAANIQLAAQLQLEVTEMTPTQQPSVYSDLLNSALSEVDWFEIAQDILDNLPSVEDESLDQFELVFSYSRAEALHDGCLVDVSKLAQEVGIKYPTAVTSGVWQKCVTVPDNAEGQDETGRLWDVLNVLRAAIQTAGNGSRLDFSVAVQGDGNTYQEVSLYSLCHAGDNGEPIITIMLPDED